MIERSTIFGFEVISVPERAGRPDATTEATAGCPFCPGAENLTPPPLLVVAGDDTWDLRVVPNLYPIVAAGAEGPRHELVIETPDHDDVPSSWSGARCLTVVQIWIDRLSSMQGRSDVAVALMFRNQGLFGGASLSHPHSHVIGLPDIPSTIASRSNLPCGICSDVASTRRLLAEHEGLLAWCPSTPAFPWEIAISTREHSGSMDAIRRFDGEIAGMLRVSLRAYAALGLEASNWILFAAPSGNEESFHWSLSLHPRISAIAGFEIGTGTMVNVVDPDDAFRELAPLFSDSGPMHR